MINYIPEWKLREQEAAQTQEAAPPEAPGEPETAPAQDAPPEHDPESFDIIGDACQTADQNDIGMTECGADLVIGMEDPDLPPR